MRQNRKALVAGVALSCVLTGMTVVMQAAAPSVDADTWLTTDPIGFVPVYVSLEGHLQVSLPGIRTRPRAAVITLVADSSVGSVFSGNFVDAGVKSVTFRIRSEISVSQPAATMLVLRGKNSGRIWRNEKLTIPAEAGVWVTNTVSFVRNAGWKREGSGDMDGLWQQDLEDVGMIGLRIGQRGRETKIYSIDAFQLLDVDQGVLADSDLVPGRVLTYFSELYSIASASDITDEMKSKDSDGDGMSDWDESWAGTNPSDANSVFEADIEEDVSQGITVKWPCVTDGVYSVMRSTNLLEGFEPIVYNLIPTPQEAQARIMSYTDAAATEDGTYIYKVVKQR